MNGLKYLASIVYGFALCLGCSQAASAVDSGASLVTRLFLNVCVPNMEKPEQVRAWANEKHLVPITADVPLSVFVGPGSKGAAWFVPSDSGSFALSIRGTTEACATWARTADPAEVEAGFKRMMEGVARPGIESSVVEDKTVATPSGQARSLIYKIKAPGSAVGFLFTMLTAEHPGGAFQASLQLAKGQENPAP